MTDYKSKLGDLADKLRKEVPETPLQEVRPVRFAGAGKEKEVQLNTWIPKGLLKRIKSYGVEHDLSVKDINIMALTSFLDAKEPQRNTTEDRS